MKEYNIVIASDHSGYLLKNIIIDYLQNKNLSVLDLGTNNNEVVDYPDYASAVVEAIVEEVAATGILICGSGIGMSIAANRRLGIRAALCTNLFMAERARLHNDANILALGAKVTDDDLSLEIVNKFLNTKFEGGRHSARIAKL